MYYIVQIRMEDIMTERERVLIERGRIKVRALSAGWEAIRTRGGNLDSETFTIGLETAVDLVLKLHLPMPIDHKRPFNEPMSFNEREVEEVEEVKVSSKPSNDKDFIYRTPEKFGDAQVNYSIHGHQSPRRKNLQEQDMSYERLSDSDTNDLPSSSSFSNIAFESSSRSFKRTKRETSSLPKRRFSTFYFQTFESNSLFQEFHAFWGSRDLSYFSLDCYKSTVKKIVEFGFTDTT